MGQRSQIILITPKVKYGNNNPNDNNGKIYEFHNQWRFGHNAILVFSDILLKLNYLIKEEQQDHKRDNTYFKLRLDEKLKLCILYAENHRINWDMSQTHEQNEITKELIEKPHTGLNCVTDNNDGWFFIKVHNNLSVSIGILESHPDTGEIRQRTVKEYLTSYEKLNLKGDDKKEFNFAIAFLESIKKFDPLKALIKFSEDNKPNKGDK